MSYYPSSLERLIHEFSKFPGIGTKSAEKLAIHILKSKDEDIKKLTYALEEVKNRCQFCSICYSLSEDPVCLICKNDQRDHGLICVVESFKDVISIEKTNEYKGLYHVLMGHLSPISGIGPEDLKIKELIDRVKNSKTEEIILATNPNVEGDATSLFIANVLKPCPVKVSRIARGLPVGGDLEFADPLTLSRSLSRREPIDT